MKKLLQIIGVLSGLLFIFPVFSQTQLPLDIALRSIESEYKNLGLTSDDVRDIAVSDQIRTAHNGMTNIYFIQRHAGIEVYNAILNYTISKDGKIIYTGNRFIPAISSKINTNKPTLTPQKAILAAAKILGAGNIDKPRLLTQSSDHSFVFDKGELSRSDIPVKLRYQLMKDGSVKLAWDLAIDYKGANDYWSMRIDALTGDLLDKNSFTVHCNHVKGKYDAADNGCHPHDITFAKNLTVSEAVAKAHAALADNQYRVIPFPFENPNQSNAKLIDNPADPVASPYGWHDLNGVPGNETTITRGNNVHAFQDRNADYTSAGDEPNGGSNLIFDFPYSSAWEPDTFTNSAVVQLFYAMNFMHDFTYNFGFDEFANFQQKNYTGNGLGNDHVIALSQFDGNTLANVNNADFSTPADGGNGRVRMFLWDNSLSEAKNIKVTAPFNIAGAYESKKGELGANITYANPVSGAAIVVNDGALENPTFGCEPLSQGNGAEVNGKIAIIDRGLCEFGTKALNAQNAGAIGCIICNFEEATISMGKGVDGGKVTIPVLSVKKSVCDKLKQYQGAGGLMITIQGPPDSLSGPALLDGSLDNGIMAHELGHGVSIRLTGGPANSGCLNNGEQMGEGWSDFLALVTTVKPGDTKDKPRGVGTYVTKENDNGKGFRTYQYSTDFSINPHTYGDIAGNTEVHYVGEVWNSMLWDLYWAFVDKYGLDPTYKDVNSGSYKAVRLVMDALKIQPCSPGFADGRDAILAADIINYNGENGCLIWDVFAKRGLGHLANQGNSNSAGDGKENFDIKPLCLNTITIKKEATPLIKAGEEIEYTITVSNYKSVPATGTVVTDQIPEGATVSNANGGTVTGDVISFDLGTLASNETKIITYSVSSSFKIWSQRQIFDNCENIDNWDIETGQGFNGWEPTTVESHSPSASFGISDVGQVNKHSLKFLKSYNVSGDRPVMRFYHNFNTEAGNDGGYVEVSTNNGSTWTSLKDKFIRNGYVSKMAYATFTLPNIEGFSGNSNGWIASYIDLSEYKGQDIIVRWKYGSNDAIGGIGWFIDDFEYMDLKTYNSEACATTSEGDNVCAMAPQEGTIVESQLVSANDLKQGELGIFPNPAQNYLNISLKAGTTGNYNVNILTLDGKIVKSASIGLIEGTNNQTVSVQGVPAGCYLIKIQNEKEYFVNKIIVKQ